MDCSNWVDLGCHGIPTRKRRLEIMGDVPHYRSWWCSYIQNNNAFPCFSCPVVFWILFHCYLVLRGNNQKRLCWESNKIAYLGFTQKSFCSLQLSSNKQLTNRKNVNRLHWRLFGSSEQQNISSTKCGSLCLNW